MKYPLVERTGGYIFMNENFEWLLSNHTLLKGEAAKQILIMTFFDPFKFFNYFCRFADKIF